MIHTCYLVFLFVSEKNVICKCFKNVTFFLNIDKELISQNVIDKMLVSFYPT